MNNMDNNEEKIDESLYSRQLYVLGREGQQRMSHATVLILGICGLGVEIAKNVILAGAKSVTIYDPTITSYMDLSSQFYLNESHIGQSRDIITVPKLAELNPYVSVSLLDITKYDNNLESVIRQGRYTVIVIVNQSLQLQLQLADLAHEVQSYVITTEVKGVFGSVFCDFGKEFTVIDNNGEQPSSSLIMSIVYDKISNSALITVLEDTRHNLINGDVVVFSEISGSIGTILNGKEFSVNVKDIFSFEISLDNYIPDIQSLSYVLTYERGGYSNQIKQSQVLSFQKMSDSIKQPNNFLGDEYKIYRAGLIHIMFQSLHHFHSKYGMYPITDNEHSNMFFNHLLEFNETNSLHSAFTITEQEIRDNENFIKSFALSCRGNLSPVCAFFGGIVGQEVLKACSGKFTPIRQWFYYDFIDCLPDYSLISSNNTFHCFQPLNCRYDGQIVVFGQEFQEKLAKLHLFLIGSGAIGCEVIKNWAMMGVAQEAYNGITYITDPDHIEKSNLSRQFLFRNHDIHKSKSITATNAAKQMNSLINIISLEQKVCCDTEDYFNDTFFSSLDIVFTALDNIEARLYVDQRCLFYQKPMFESGTLGTKGHTQVVLPFQTEHYGATRDPPEKSIPMCTLKFFPNQIEHTLQWAREWFEEVSNIIISSHLTYLL